MKKTLAILGVVAFLLLGCKPEQKPVDTETPDVENPGNKDPEQGENQEPEKPVYRDVTLHGSFKEDFSAKTSDFFDFSFRENADDFRYYSGFPSWNENGTTLLMLRIDPADGVGVLNGPLVQTKDYTFYGSYSMRVRLPNAKAVQPNVGVNVVMSTMEDDPKNGYSNIELTMKLADLSMIYVGAQIGIGVDFKKESEILKDLPSAVKLADAYNTIGFDWHADKVVWWYLYGSEKKPLFETATCVPTFPARFRLSYYHTMNNPVESNPNAKVAPAYPFELELDKMSYEPFEDEIKAWRDEYFKK